MFYSLVTSLTGKISSRLALGRASAHALIQSYITLHICACLHTGARSHSVHHELMLRLTHVCAVKEQMSNNSYLWSVKSVSCDSTGLLRDYSLLYFTIICPALSGTTSRKGLRGNRRSSDHKSFGFPPVQKPINHPFGRTASQDTRSGLGLSWDQIWVSKWLKNAETRRYGRLIEPLLLQTRVRTKLAIKWKVSPNDKACHLFSFTHWSVMLRDRRCLLALIFVLLLTSWSFAVPQKGKVQTTAAPGFIFKVECAVFGFCQFIWVTELWIWLTNFCIFTFRFHNWLLTMPAYLSRV